MKPIYLITTLVIVTASPTKLTAQVPNTTKTNAASAGVKALDYTLQLDVLSEGHDNKTEWGWPRVGLIPPKTAVVLMHRSSLFGSDTVLSTHDMRTDDFGATWTKPQLQPNLGRRAFDGNPNVDFSPIDLVPAWHAASGKLLALHDFHAWPLLRFILDRDGQRFLAECGEQRIEVEYELHLMTDLLERWRFERESADLFRMNAKGQRVADANLCVSNDRALDIVAQNAAALSRILKPATGRHFYWGDDGGGWCHCAKCRELGDSDQALIVENRILTELRKDNPAAQLAHLAYHGTLHAPKVVKPLPGVFLEFAPIDRAYAPHLGKPFVALRERGNRPRPVDVSNGKLLGHLDANLAIFPAETAQALEYWLDVSVFSRGSKTPRLLHLDEALLAADLAEYARRGVRHITTFAVQVNQTYLQHHPDPQPMLDAYGKALSSP